MHINLFNGAHSMAIAGTALTSSLLVSKNWTNNHLFQNVTSVALLYLGYKIIQQAKKNSNFTVEHPIEKQSAKKGKKVEVQRKVAPQYLQLGLQAVGIAFACYGVYTIASNVLGFNSSQTILDEAKRELFNCPPAKKLWDETLKDGSFVVRYANNNDLEALNGGNGFAQFSPNRQIVLKKDNPNFSNTMLLEIINLKGEIKSSAILWDMCKISPSAFAKKIEILEYNNGLTALETTSECVKNHNWPAARLAWIKNHFALWKGTLDGYLQRQEVRGHTQYYRNYWHKECGR